MAKQGGQDVLLAKEHERYQGLSRWAIPNRHHQNDLNASFKPVQLNRRQLRQQKNLGASVRHVYRRKSGTTEAYKTAARKSTMALDLPPLS